MESMRDLVGEKVSPQRYGQLKLTKYLFKDKLLQKHSAKLESMLRKMVREEVEHAIQLSPLSSSSPLPNMIDPSKSRQYKLQFEGKLPSTLFTDNKVEAEGPSPIRLLLLDAVSGDRITDGPLSSKKVEIVVVHGHFNTENLEDWTKEEFCSHMVSKRNYNKRPLLIGKRVITLQNGIGYLGDILFTDNSSWGRTKMFRLGAQVVAQHDQVREAVSSAFQVKHRRGETYKKHDIPSLEDEVWRLRGIARDGKICKRLKEHQIYKVEDLVTKFYNDESSLRQIEDISPRQWKGIIQQATTCISGQASTNLSNLTQINIPADSIVNPITTPGLNMQQHSVPPALQAQQEIQMSEYHAGEHSHQLNQSTTLDEFLLPDSSLDYCSMPPSSTNLFSDVQNPTWFPAQSTGESSYCSFMNLDERICSSTPGAGFNSPANPDNETG